MSARPKRFIVDVTVAMHIHARHAGEARAIGHERMLTALGYKDCTRNCPIRRISASEHGVRRFHRRRR